MTTATARQKIETLEQKLHNLNRVKFDNFQSLQYLLEWQLGELREFDNGASSEKVCECDDKMEFKVCMPKGASLPEHWHDCSEEIHVLDGSLVDVRLHKNLKAGDTLFIPRGTVHQPVNLSNISCTLLCVIFYKKI